MSCCKRWAALLGLVLLVGCGHTTGDSAKESKRLVVLCTTAQIADIVRNVAGDHVEVSSLMGPGDDPHSYLPKPREASRLNQADVVFYNGLHLEGRMADMLEKMAANRPVYRIVDSAMRDHAELLIETSDFDGHYDPHVWFDPTLWAHCVDYVADKLAEHDPDHKDDFLSGAAAYKTQLSQLQDEATARLETIDKSRRVLVTAHDAFGYFGKRFGLEVHGLQGLSSADEASLGRINELVEMLVAAKIKAVFIESSVPERHIQSVIDECKRKGHPVAIGGELFSDAMGAEGTSEGTYLGMMRHNVKTIVEALK